MLKVRWWESRLYKDATAWNVMKAFFRVLDEQIQPHFQVLDIGAGAGLKNVYSFKGRVQRMVGVDLDPRVKTNPLLDEGVIGDLTQFPLEDNSFDLAFSIYVLEHIAQPERFLHELRRILKPGGLFLFLTPNRHHYVSLVSMLTPTSFHRWFNRKARGRLEEDTFPTTYRMNTRGQLRRLFQAEGFETVQLKSVEGTPSYLTFSTPTYLLGAGYERLVNSSEWFSEFRVNIIGVFRKQSAPETLPPTNVP